MRCELPSRHGSALCVLSCDRQVCEHLLVPELMDIFRRFKRPLQAIFSGYCARNKVDASCAIPIGADSCEQMGAKASWDSIARSNVTMSIGKFLLFAREFDMLPHIVTKQVLHCTRSLQLIFWCARLLSEYTVLPTSLQRTRMRG